MPRSCLCAARNLLRAGLVLFAAHVSRPRFTDTCGAQDFRNGEQAALLLSASRSVSGQGEPDMKINRVLEGPRDSASQQIQIEDREPDAFFSTRMEFAQHCFNNTQSLIRAIDDKANSLIASVGILTGALGVLISAALNLKPDSFWSNVLTVGEVILTLAYLLTAFGVIYPATLVNKALPNSLRPDTAAPGLMFPLMLISRYSANGKADEEMYFAQLQASTPDDLLRDYANQIVEISTIYQYKQGQLATCMRNFRWLSIQWIISAVILVIAIMLLSVR